MLIGLSKKILFSLRPSHRTYILLRYMSFGLSAPAAGLTMSDTRGSKFGHLSDRDKELSSRQKEVDSNYNQEFKQG